MANVVRDPRQHPDAFIPDFSKPNALLTFSKDDVAFVYGSRRSNATLQRLGTIISRNRRNGMSRTARGNDISYLTMPIGGLRFIHQIISSARLVRSATAATQ